MRHDRPTTVCAAPSGMHRRRFLAFAGAAAGGAILAACGGDTAPTPTPAPTAGVGATTTRAAGSATANPATGTAVTGSTVATRAIGSAIAGTVTGTAVSGSAGAGTPSAGGQTLVIEAFDFGYKTMGVVPGGLTRVQLRNTGKDVHQAQFMLLNPGVGLEVLGAAFQKGPDEAFKLVSFVGGPGAIAPGGMAEVLLDLKEGQYMLACFAQGADHLPHTAKGMVLPLIVTAPAGAPAPAPRVDGTITLYDFNFTMPDTLPAGRSMWRVTNTGAQFHEFAAWQLMPGKTVDDFRQFFDAPPNAPVAGPPPALPIGGMQALTRGNEGILALDLKAGEYVATCMVPDQSKANGESHLHLGMVKGFSVR